MERRLVLDSYWLKTPRTPSVAPGPWYLVLTVSAALADSWPGIRPLLVCWLQLSLFESDGVLFWSYAVTGLLAKSRLMSRRNPKANLVNSRVPLGLDWNLTLDLSCMSGSTVKPQRSLKCSRPTTMTTWGHSRQGEWFIKIKKSIDKIVASDGLRLWQVVAHNRPSKKA